VAPGTAASAITVLVLGAVPFSTLGLALTLIVVLVVGTWAADRAERLMGDKDPGAIVIDEVAGMMLSVLLLPRTISVLVVGFLLFRVLDVMKPFPAGASQRLRGGVGVMIDDVIAGCYALVVLLGLRAALGWP
jgi:phosphatidylglycerophosphatase A